jgi:hypothetical protein
MAKLSKASQAPRARPPRKDMYELPSDQEVEESQDEDEDDDEDEDSGNYTHHIILLPVPSLIYL